MRSCVATVCICASSAAILLLVDKKENIDQLVAASTEYSAISIKILLLVFSIYYLFVIGIRKYCGW
jgi:hypothetical protein